MKEEYKCQFCGYAPPNIRDDDGNDTGMPESWSKGSCPRTITPAPAACGLRLEEGQQPLVTDPDYADREDLMEAVRTEGPHIADLLADEGEVDEGAAAEEPVKSAPVDPRKK